MNAIETDALFQKVQNLTHSEISTLINELAIDWGDWDTTAELKEKIFKTASICNAMPDLLKTPPMPDNASQTTESKE